MLSKNELKYYSSLLQKKYRKIERKFLVEGERLVFEGLDSNFKCELLVVSKDYNSANIMELEKRSYKCARTEVISNSEFGKISDTKSPQGVAAVFAIPTLKGNFDHDLIVALENISDPGNVGTIIRNCDWFGIQQVMLSDDCADIYNPKVVRSTMGSLFHLEVHEVYDFYTSLSELKLEGYELLCADMTGNNVYDIKLDRKSILVFCNEANGPTKKLLKITDKQITIPKIGKAESLNVANASAVVLSHLTK